MAMHHSALAANELGGRMSIKSGGLGEGANFALILPGNKKSNI